MQRLFLMFLDHT